MIRLPAGSTRLHLLRTPLARTRDRDRAERSRWTWGPDPTYPDVYTVTVLGALHTLTGLVIEVPNHQ